jgi:hypothetical protein
MSQNTPLKHRARLFSQVIAHVFVHQKLSGGKLVEASRGARHLSLGVRLVNPTELETGRTDRPGGQLRECLSHPAGRLGDVSISVSPRLLGVLYPG